jgi:hypothetical protein
MLTRYEELTRKCYSLLACVNRCYAAGSYRFAWMWQKKMSELYDIRDAMTVGEGMEPADNERMGKYALS